MAQETIEMASGVCSFIRTAADLQGKKITIDSAITYDCNYCGDYALYYLNSHGGWDSFLIEGKVQKTDNITQYKYSKSFNNTTIEYESGRYISEIATKYVCYTSWLTDAQSANLAKNLLSSNKVYLHDLVNNKIIPVIIENTTIDYKKYFNERQMISYKINLVESQTKIKK